MIFIVNAFSILLYGLIVKRKLTEDKYKKRYLVLCFFQMLLIQGLRSTEVGTDTIMYTEVYNNYLHSEYYAFCFTHFESGFQLLYNFLHRVSADEQGLLITISAKSNPTFTMDVFSHLMSGLANVLRVTIG